MRKKIACKTELAALRYSDEFLEQYGKQMTELMLKSVDDSPIHSTYASRIIPMAIVGGVLGAIVGNIVVRALL